MLKSSSEKSVLVIGLGRFGRHLAMRLQEFGGQVMVVDKDEAVVQENADIFNNSITADATSESVIKSLGINNFDICVVAVGENFEAAVIVTSLLKNAGAKNVIARVGSGMQEEVLLKVGADSVVYPERDFAEKLALRFSFAEVLDYFEVAEDYCIFEITVPDTWIGKSIEAINVRGKYKLNILLVKNNNILPMPQATYTFKKNDRLVVMGKEKDILKMI